MSPDTTLESLRDFYDTMGVLLDRTRKLEGVHVFAALGWAEVRSLDETQLCGSRLAEDGSFILDRCLTLWTDREWDPHPVVKRVAHLFAENGWDVSVR